MKQQKAPNKNPYNNCAWGSHGQIAISRVLVLSIPETIFLLYVSFDKRWFPTIMAALFPIFLLRVKCIVWYAVLTPPRCPCCAIVWPLTPPSFLRSHSRISQGLNFLLAISFVWALSSFPAFYVFLLTGRGSYSQSSRTVILTVGVRGRDGRSSCWLLLGQTVNLFGSRYFYPCKRSWCLRSPFFGGSWRFCSLWASVFPASACLRSLCSRPCLFCLR